MRGRSSRSWTRSGASPDEREELTIAWTWLAAGDFDVGLELLIDPLSLVMMLIVTGIGGLIVAYSNAYMAGDDEERRYFAYMSFFVFSMLMLVEGGNLLMLLIGWGLVGLASAPDRLPPRARRSRREEGVRHQRARRHGARLLPLIFQVGSLDYGVVFDAANPASSPTPS